MYVIKNISVCVVQVVYYQLYIYIYIYISHAYYKLLQRNTRVWLTMVDAVIFACYHQLKC